MANHSRMACCVDDADFTSSDDEVHRLPISTNNGVPAHSSVQTTIPSRAVEQIETTTLECSILTLPVPPLALHQLRVQPHILPSGNVVDCKNTLQSYPSPPRAVANTTAALPTHANQPTKELDDDHEAAMSGVAAPSASLDLSAAGMSDNTKDSNKDTQTASAAADISISLDGTPYGEPGQAITETEHVYAANGLPIHMRESLAATETRRKILCRFGWLTANIVLLVAVIVTASLCHTGGCLRDNKKRERLLVQFFRNITLSQHADHLLDIESLDTLSSNASSEKLAMCWLLRDDPMQLTPTSPVDRFRLTQRYAIATLWAHTTQFAPGFTAYERDVCDWQGIICNPVDIGKNIGTHNAVTAIKLSRSSWTGTIGFDLGLLSHLVHFDMSMNTLIGTIPSSIGRHWTKLTEFYVESNRLIGMLPDSIGQWTELMYFDISANGDYISANGDDNEFLFYTDISGVLPTSVGKWSHLVAFRSAFNSLNAPLPKTMESWSRLQEFNIDENALATLVPNARRIPNFMGSWTALVSFSASYNSFSGSLPMFVGQWSKLQYLNVDGNSFYGELPKSIGNLTMLKHFECSNNGFTGILPNSMAKWTQLEHLDASFNFLSGTLPMFGSPHLQNISVFNNSIGGNVPTNMCSAANLTYIVVDCDEVSCTCGSDKCQCDSLSSGVPSTL